MVRHPGLPYLAPDAPAFSRSGLSQVSLLSTTSDVEWRPAAGAITFGETRRGGNRLSFVPYGSFSSAKLGGRLADNPADSPGSSLQIGAAMSGPIRADTAHFFLGFDYQALEEPSAERLVADTSRFGGATVPLAETLRSVARDSFGLDLSRAVSPPLRTWKGGAGLGRVDFAIAGKHLVTLRAALGSWKERAPAIDGELGNSSGLGLDGRDASVMVAISTAGAAAGTSISNEARLSVATARRDWTDGAIPSTSLIRDRAVVGGVAFAPGRFSQRHIDLVEAFQLGLGRHRLKLGGGLRVLRYDQEYAFGQTPIVWYDGLDDLARGKGATFAVSGVDPVSFNVVEPAGFVQDVWTITPEIELLLGLRYEIQAFGSGAITPNTEWTGLSGIPTGVPPKDRQGWAPRAAMTWNLRGEGRTVVRLTSGLTHDRLDPVTMAEAITFDGGARVHRVVGDLASWPNPLPASGTSNPALTVFSDRYRTPRAFETSASVAQALGGGARLTVTAQYHHTDFLLRRVDLNRALAGAKSSDNRPLFGSLIKVGSLVAAAPGSNRRFPTFDLVSWLEPTGYSDYYEITGLLERRLGTGLNLQLAYTMSKAQDNVLGLLSPDPASQLNPFPSGLDGRDWAQSRSDLDVPHRLTGMLEYRGTGRAGLVVGVRARYRSGLPFTAGLPAGVDVNGDGAVANDPAFLTSGLSGIAEALANGNCPIAVGIFATRNSCREKGVGSVDLRLGVDLPLGSLGRRLRLTVDAFNLVSTNGGLVDHALLLIDPTRQLTTSATGIINIPTLINPRFGSVLVRRGGARWIRAGLRLEY